MIIHIYCQIHVFSQFVINSDTMQGKCRTLRLKIILFQIMGPCNLTGGYQGFGQTYCLHLPVACEDRPRMFLQKRHMYQIIWWPNPDHIMNPHHCDQNFRRAVHFFKAAFSTNCVHHVSYFVPHKLRKWLNTHFRVRTTYAEFQSSTKLYHKRKLSFWWWNFLHSNTVNLQHALCYKSANTQNITNCNTKNKFQEYMYIKECVY
jgi:hypothetical protein